MATKLSSQQSAQVSKVLGSGGGVVLQRGRKNIGIAIAVVNDLIEKEVRRTKSSDVAHIITSLGLDTYWNRDEYAKDDGGLAKSLGDLMGQHGLRLDRSRVGKTPCFVLPTSPIDRAWLRAKGIDPDTCGHEAVESLPEEEAVDAEPEKPAFQPFFEGEVEPQGAEDGPEPATGAEAKGVDYLIAQTMDDEPTDEAEAEDAGEEGGEDPESDGAQGEEVANV